MKDSILAVVIVYNPDIELLIKNIRAFIDCVEKIIIWKNSQVDSTRIVSNYVQEEKILFFGSGENIGISKVLNYTLRYAINSHYDYLLTMDQDSIWLDFKSYKDSVLKKNKEELCICGPFTGIETSSKPLGSGFLLNRWQITSGMLARTEFLNNLGGYNERFMVDCIDIDLCLRAKSKGYNSYYCYEGFLQQQYGTPLSVKFLGKIRNYTYYNPFRVRGIIGGHIILYRKYKHPDLPNEIKRYIKEAIKSIVYSRKNLFSLFLALICGLCDGFLEKIDK